MFKGQPKRGLPLFPNFSKVSFKLALGVILLIFLTQYQPSASLPFIKQSIVRAQESNEQRHAIFAEGLPFKFQTLFPGYLSQHFSNWHKALDIATGLGMPIKPIAGGTVVSAGYDWFGYGLKVEIDHGNGYKSLYAHLGKIYVEKDQKIESNHYIGEVGLTGRTTGPHTHLEVQKDNQYIDPETILPQIREYAVAEDFKPVGGHGFNNLAQPKQTPKPAIPDLALEPAAKKPESKDKDINTLNNVLNLTTKPVKTKSQELAELLKINL